METRRHRRARQGLTLIEVLIVVGVLFLLAGILMPVRNPAREKARRVNCAGNLKLIGVSLLMYSGDHAGYFPNVRRNFRNTNFEPLISKQYAQDGRHWSCPSRVTVMTLGRDSAYRYVGSGLKDDNATATGTRIAYDQSGNHPSNEWCNALFIDGHVEGAKPANQPDLFGND